ncbi:polysaccharide export protein EpsE [Paucibacter sp. KBW04]|uniref:polysaccharide export protein EpsE n=1 Tax=Paucibacter sp. KBW04 TaxID=2153361 RepID=UPI001E2E1D15|nr:polysaccharide export protein EpsE [Paucibacter sp. KBW04]
MKMLTRMQQENARTIRPLGLSGLALSLSLVLAMSAAPAAAQTAAAAPASAATQSAEYRLGSGDVMRVTVYQNPDLTLETRVSENGLVSYPLLGNIKVGGLSVTQAENLISEGLKKGNFVKNPQTTIVVLQVKGNQASVLGNVNRPGRYPIETADMRLTDLIATAGGVASTGAEVLVVSGKRNGQPYRVEIDLPAIFAPGGSANDIFIQHGDVVWVDRAPMVYIYGEVQRPGPMKLERGMTVMQSLATGGGITLRGTEKGIRVNRKDSEGKVETLQLPMDAPLKDGDVVYVKESLF